MTRRQAREQAFFLIFEKSFQEESSIEEITEYAALSGAFEPNAFAVGLSQKVYDNLEDIDGRIKPCLKGWAHNRISKVSSAIMRLSVCEMLFYPAIPVGVSINEAVELTKTYGTPEDAAFVNGVLGNISRQLEKEKKTDEEIAKPLAGV